MRLATLILLVAAGAMAATIPYPLVSSKKPTASSSYNPSNDLTGLVFWANPDSQTEADGDAIVTLLDNSGNGRDFIQTDNTARRATLKKNIINGKATFRASTITGMYRDSFPMPADVSIFFASSNAAAWTTFQHDSHWFLTFGNSRQYNFPDIGQKLVSSGFNVVSYVCTNGGQVFWENGVPMVGFTASKAAGSGRMMLFSDLAYSYTANADYGEFLVYSNASMTASRKSQIEGYLGDKYGKTMGVDASGRIKIFCVGDSITAAGGFNTEPGGDDSWPARLRTSLGSGYELVNLGVSGQTLLQESNAAPAQVHPFHGNGTNILLLWEYVNSIVAAPYGGDTQGAHGTNEVFQMISNYISRAQSAGWTKIIACTDFHTNQNVQNVSSAVQASYLGMGATHLADLNTAAIKAHSTTNAGDGIHLDAGGWQHVANIVSNVVKTIYP